MLSESIRWKLRFVLIIGGQVLVLNHVEFSAWLYPMIYIFFILMLPLRLTPAVLMGFAFLTGLTVDIFTNTAGMHASACIVMAAFRPFVLRIIEPPTGYDEVGIPGIYNLGFTWFLTYTIMLAFVHHLIYFFWEIYSFRHISFMFGKTFFSTLFSVFLIGTLSFLVYSREKTR